MNKVDLHHIYNLGDQKPAKNHQGIKLFFAVTWVTFGVSDDLVMNPGNVSIFKHNGVLLQFKLWKQLSRKEFFYFLFFCKFEGHFPLFVLVTNFSVVTKPKNIFVPCL